MRAQKTVRGGGGGTRPNAKHYPVEDTGRRWGSTCRLLNLKLHPGSLVLVLPKGQHKE